MTHRLLRLIGVVMLLMPATPVAVAQQTGAPAPPPPPSNTVQSERTVQILWDSDAPTPDISGVLGRLFGKDGAGELAKSILGVDDPESAKKVAGRYGRLELAPGSCQFSFRTVSGPRAASKEFADALVERLSSLLLEDRQKHAQEQMARARDEMRELEFELDAVRRRAKEKQAKLLAVAGRADLSAASLLPSIGKLEDEKQRLELELAGMEARLEAVQEQIVKVTEQAKKQAADDPVIAELEKAVAARHNLVELARKRFEAGLVQPHEMSTAEAELAEARVQLLDRRGLASARGGDAIVPLTRELQTLAIDARDRKARLAHVDKRLEPLRGLSDEFQELEWLQEEATQLRRAADQAEERLRAAQNGLQASRVDRVIVTTASDQSATGETTRPGVER